MMPSRDLLIIASSDDSTIEAKMRALARWLAFSFSKRRRSVTSLNTSTQPEMPPSADLIGGWLLFNRLLQSKANVTDRSVGAFIKNCSTPSWCIGPDLFLCSLDPSGRGTQCQS